MNMLSPIVLPSAKERVVSELRKAILSKKMEEGEILSLENVAGQLNVSITPVREAFQILDRDGLIKLRKNKGAVVLGITDTYIKEHYQLRGILEASAVKLVCENKSDLSDIELILNKAGEEIEAGDYSDYAQYNRAFHHGIWKLCGNSKMEKMIGELWNGLSMGSMITEEEYAKISYNEHRQIYNAMKEGNAGKAYDKMYEHIMRSGDDMLTYYK